MTSTFMNFLIDACLFVGDLPQDNRAGFVNKLALNDLVIIDSFLGNHKDPPYTCEPNEVTSVSIMANIFLNVNWPINSAAGKKMVIKRVGNRLTFTAIPTTEPQVSVNSTISITNNRTSDLAGIAGYYG